MACVLKCVYNCVCDMGRGSGGSPVVQGVFTGRRPVPRGDGMSGFAMAVAKGWRGGDRRKGCWKRELWPKNGLMVLRAIGAGKRQNLGSFATRWFGGAGKYRGLPRRGVAKGGGFCNENAGKHGFSLQNSAARKWQNVPWAGVAAAGTDEFRKSDANVLRNRRTGPGPCWEKRAPSRSGSRRTGVPTCPRVA